MNKAHTIFLTVGIVIGLSVGTFIPEGIQIETSEQNETQETIVSYRRSGTFTEEERAEIEEKVINVYADYNKCQTGSEALVARVEKIDNENYLYDIEIYSSPMGSAGFLHGTPDEELEYYTPDLILTECLHTLPHAEELKDRAIDDYQG
jgi:hypothetical protein